MYNIKLENYVPIPNPATSDRIVAAHYYAAWKKGAAGIHNAFDDLHDYPERTPLMGYYDEENPEVCDWEIKWALEHGINCFIYCWYRKLDNMGKPVTVNDLRAGHGIHEALFNAKYQDKMNFAIMFENSPRWGTTDSEDIIENLMPFWVENYFSKSNYLKIDNKPVLFIYNGIRLEEVFGDKETQRKAFDACRDYAKKCGFNGMIFALENSCVNPITTKEQSDNVFERGYDFIFGYNAGYDPDHNYPSAKEIIDAQCNIYKKKLSFDEKRYIPTASCFSDPTPRTTQHWIDMGYEFYKMNIWKLSPDEFRDCIHRLKDITQTLPEDSWGRKIFMIDNWNEWDEGHYVSPSHEFGFRFLQAIREELTERNNLPDYRMPQDMGFEGYNKSWTIPDFKELCEQKLKGK